MKLTHNVGLGDVIKYGLGKLGIKQKPGCPCPKRQAWLNDITPGYRPKSEATGRTGRAPSRALFSLRDGPVRTGRQRVPRFSYPGKPVVDWYPFSAYPWISGGSPCDHNVAAGSSSATIDSLINGASVLNGQTVCLASGAYSWTSTINISKHVALQGAGKTLTLVTNNNTTGHGINLTESTLGNSRISDIGFLRGTGPVNLGGTFQQFIRVISGGSNGRPVIILSNDFDLRTGTSSSQNAIGFAVSRGLVSNNTVTAPIAGTQCANQASFIRVKLTPTPAAASWESPAAWGNTDTNGDKSVFIETNTITDTLQALDNDDGGRVVVRHNTIINSHMGGHGCDTSPVGARTHENYNNDYQWDGTDRNCGGDGSTPVNLDQGFVFARGGTLLIHSNTFDNITSAAWGDKTEVRFAHFNLRQSAGPCPCVSTYPLPHQIGMGWITGSGLSGSCNLVQDSQPMYLWNNSGAGNFNNPLIADFNGQECAGDLHSSDYILVDRDFFLSAPPFSYTPFAYPHPLLGGVPPQTSVTRTPTAGAPALSGQAPRMNLGVRPPGSQRN